MAKKWSSYSQGRVCNNINLTLTFEGQDGPECLKQEIKSMYLNQLN